MILTCKTPHRGVQTYEGIMYASEDHVNQPPDANFLARVFLDGDAECWWLADDHAALEELERYFRSEHGYDTIKVELWKKHER